MLKFNYNQQVAADIQYKLRPDSTHSALRNAQLFNIVAVYPTAIVKRRAWFGFDRDVRMNDLLKPIIHSPEDIAALKDRIENGQTLNHTGAELFGDEAVKMVLASSQGPREISLQFDDEMNQDEISAFIAENIYFERLARLIERISRALKHEERGALLKVDISHSPAHSMHI